MKDYKEKPVSPVYKIKFSDTMTSYFLSETFKTREEAQKYIDLELGESSLYEIEKVYLFELSE